MPVAEFRSWQAYADIEHFGGHYDDMRAGAIVAAIYNVNRDQKRSPQPFQPLDFMPWNDLAQRQDQPIVLPDAAAEQAALNAAFGLACDPYPEP